MKTKEELAMIKSEYEDVKDKLTELTDEELEQVTGGFQGSDTYAEAPACSEFFPKSGLSGGYPMICGNCSRYAPASNRNGNGKCHAPQPDYIVL